MSIAMMLTWTISDEIRENRYCMLHCQSSAVRRFDECFDKGMTRRSPLLTFKSIYIKALRLPPSTKTTSTLLRKGFEALHQLSISIEQNADSGCQVSGINRA